MPLKSVTLEKLEQMERQMQDEYQKQQLKEQELARQQQEQQEAHAASLRPHY
jgi:Cilia BBSome complex subunit 10